VADSNNEETKEFEITPELEEDYKNTQIRLQLLRDAHTSILNQINWEHEAFLLRHPYLKD
jgi:hypothetical protein